MATIIIPTTQNIELEYPVASMGDRMFASLIDIVVIIGYVLIWVMLGFEFETTAQIILYVLPTSTYTLFCEIFFNGRTLGKYAMNLQVIKMDGSRPSISAYFLRWSLRVVDIWLSSGLGLPGLVALITTSVNKRGQRLGDLAAGTTVIKLKLVYSFGDTIFRETKEDHQVQFPKIGELSDRDVSILKEVLDAGLRTQNPELLERLKIKICEVTGIETAMPPHQFLETVLKDYNHLFGRN